MIPLEKRKIVKNIDLNNKLLDKLYAWNEITKTIDFNNIKME